MLRLLFGGCIVTSYKTALVLAVLSGVVAGAVVGRVRAAVHKGDLGPAACAALGGFGAAAIFGALVAFHGVLYFLTGPEPVCAFSHDSIG